MTMLEADWHCQECGRPNETCLCQHETPCPTCRLVRCICPDEDQGPDDKREGH